MWQRIGSIALFILLWLSLTAGLAGITAQTATQGMTVDILNVRAAPSATATILTLVNARVRVAIEGRNEVGNWVLIHTPDNAIRGWVASRYIAFDAEVNLSELPVTAETIGGAAPPSVEAPSAAPASTDAAQGVTIDMLNVRAGPGSGNTVLTQVGAQTRIVIEGRNAAGDWLLIHKRDNTIRGWVAARYVALDAGVTLADLPVVNETIGVTTTTATIGESPQSLEAMHQRLWDTPILYNATSGTVYSLFQRGRALGNNPRVFIKVGDSMTALQPFLLGFGNGMYDLGSYGYLQETINFFSVPLNSGESNCFSRYSLAAAEGFLAFHVMDPLWSNPGLCPVHGEPLLCEYDINRPAVALVLFGPLDAQFGTADLFRANMTTIVSELVNRGVIPVLSTYPSANWFNWEQSLIFNNVILDIAAQFDVPLINLWRATQLLPGQGINDDGFHLSTGRTHYLQGQMTTDAATPYRFNGEEELFGVTLRNLLTLQMLDELRRNVLGQ